MHRRLSICRKLLAATILIAFAAANGSAEDVIWRVTPNSKSTTKNRVVTGSNFGPGNNILAEYALSNVFVDPDRFDDAQPGVVNQITTWFADDGVQFGEVDGIARLNLFVVPAADVLPTFDDDPDLGIDVPVTYTQTTKGGIKVIRVQANDLGNLPQPILIQENVRYYIGLTPVFNENNVLFEGNHFSNVSPKDLESASAVRTTAPPPIEDWEFAEDQAGDRLYATIEIRGFTTPNIYLSTLGFGEGALPAGNEIVGLGTGQSTTIYLWVNQNLAVDTALSLDVNLLAADVAEFSSSEVFEAVIFAAGLPVDVRWSLVEPGVLGPDRQSVMGMAGLAFKGGTGIVPENTGPIFLDDLYDPTANAFLFGVLEIKSIAMGTTDIALSEGPFGIINTGQLPLPVFGGMTICNVLAGDVNLDGALNLLDVEPFVNRISSGQYQAEADVNKDGSVNLLDVKPFIKLLGSG